MRRTQVSTGDRSAKIRTYNFPQSRVTDHRIGFTSHDIDAVMNGELAPLVEALQVADVEERLADD
jgi:peptide chain release factor 1